MLPDLRMILGHFTWFCIISYVWNISGCVGRPLCPTPENTIEWKKHSCICTWTCGFLNWKGSQLKRWNLYTAHCWIPWVRNVWVGKVSSSSDTTAIPFIAKPFPNTETEVEGCRRQGTQPLYLAPLNILSYRFLSCSPTTAALYSKHAKHKR